MAQQEAACSASNLMTMLIPKPFLKSIWALDVQMAGMCSIMDISIILLLHNSYIIIIYYYSYFIGCLGGLEMILMHGEKGL